MEVPALSDATQVGQVSLTARNCTFSGNHGARGGAIWVENYPRVVLKKCTFAENAAIFGDGGAVWVRRVLELRVDDSTFRGNVASPGAETAGVGSGGALSVHSARNLQVVYDSRGQPRTVSRESVFLSHCVFENNTAVSGGGLYLDDSC